MRFRGVAITVIVFAAAMAYLESAVVVYLQRALSITPDELFPLRSPDLVGDLAAIETGRELATLVMLGAVGFMVGRGWIERLAWTSVAFGIWDIGYYLWLWVFIGWPHSPNTWDVLFLIPVPWAGPVWAPVAVSVALAAMGLAAAHEARAGRIPRVSPVKAAAAVAGGVLVVVSFTANAPALLEEQLYGWFPWPIFVAGMALAGWAAVASLKLSPGATVTPDAGTADRLDRPLDRAV